jgi:hypothetical protein
MRRRVMSGMTACNWDPSGIVASTCHVDMSAPLRSAGLEAPIG